jgi:hypothetical protein
MTNPSNVSFADNVTVLNNFFSCMPDLAIAWAVPYLAFVRSQIRPCSVQTGAGGVFCSSTLTSSATFRLNKCSIGRNHRRPYVVSILTASLNSHLKKLRNFILGWCILLRLYINVKIKPPLFATISHRVYIIHVSYYMFRLYISHLQVFHV